MANEKPGTGCCDEHPVPGFCVMEMRGVKFFASTNMVQMLRVAVV